LAKDGRHAVAHVDQDDEIERLSFRFDRDDFLRAALIEE